MILKSPRWLDPTGRLRTHCLLPLMELINRDNPQEITILLWLLMIRRQMLKCRPRSLPITGIKTKQIMIMIGKPARNHLVIPTMMGNYLLENHSLKIISILAAHSHSAAFPVRGYPWHQFTGPPLWAPPLRETRTRKGNAIVLATARGEGSPSSTNHVSSSCLFLISQLGESWLLCPNVGHDQPSLFFVYQHSTLSADIGEEKHPEPPIINLAKQTLSAWGVGNCWNSTAWLRKVWLWFTRDITH